jgi:hypothetical protein
MQPFIKPAHDGSGMEPGTAQAQKGTERKWEGGIRDGKGEEGSTRESRGRNVARGFRLIEIEANEGSQLCSDPNLRV